MLVSVRDAVAKCPHCGDREFVPQGAGEPGAATGMRCAGCGALTTYRALLDQIGDEAMRRANESLARLKKSSPRRRTDKK